MRTVKNAFVVALIFHVFQSSCFAQLQPVYRFQDDDTILKKKYLDQSLDRKKTLIASLGKQYADDYKEVYKDQFREVELLLKSTRSLTAPEAHSYLQSVLQKIVEANEELKGLQLRVVFSRDWWPNAYSMGEGTLAVNAGLMVYLGSEAELVFVLCHELAHFQLDHSNKKIKKYIETVNSDEIKKELKRLSKEQYRVGQQLAELEKSVVFDSRRHSRDNEAEADRQAFRFMKNTGYDCNAIVSVLQLLDKIDDTLLFKPLELERVFNLNEYPFKKKWTQKETTIFSQAGDESTLTKKEKDSLKTHPDCSIRISLLEDSIKKVSSPEKKKFMVDEDMFNRLKKEFIIEITEQNFKSKNLSRNLYYSLLLLQNEVEVPMAVYSIARCLNLAYEHTKNHRFGTMLDAESKIYPADYNLLLRMLNRIRLEEIAALNYYFCARYLTAMKDYEGFTEEMMKAQKVFKP
jgi:Zn-dependent protease with chaperone function